MGQHHALGITSAAGGVLQEGEIRAANRGVAPWGRFLLQFRHRDDVAQFLDLRSQQPRHQLGFGYGDQRHGLGVAQQPGMAAQMLFDLRRADRRIDRHRYAARQQDAEKSEKILGAGREHDGGGLSGLQSAFPQSSGHRPGALPQSGVGESGVDPIVVAVNLDGHPLGLAPDMPVQHVDQGFGAVRGTNGCGLLRRRRLPVRRERGCLRRLAAGPQDQLQQVAWTFRQQHLFV